MKNIQKYKYPLFVLSILSMMALSGSIVYAVVTTSLSPILGVILILAAGICLSTLIYYGYDVDKK